MYAGLEVSGASGVYKPVLHAEDDDFGQAGALYRTMDAEARADQAIRERDGLAAELDAGRQAVLASQASADTRVKAIDAEREVQGA